MALSATQVKEQELILDEAKANVATQALEMKRCLDKGKLMDGLKHASIMLSELKTSLLAPKYYYELYTCIADEMRHLEQFLLDEYRKGRRVEDLYELVQYAGNILPRLYLLVTVGVVYMQTEEQQCFVRDILRDMVEMCRGIQHPLRGLFLRNYLIQTTKHILPDKLPTNVPQVLSEDSQLPQSNEVTDSSGSVSGVGSSVHDSVDYILMNLTEMSKLWVRMQYQGHTKERGLREQERKDLKQLVGANVYALSSLESLHVEMYKNKVLPIMLAQLVNSRDPLAQEYLMEVIIHVFPDEFHLATLQMYLDACSNLHEDVDLNSIITTLIARLSLMADEQQGGIGIPHHLQLFSVFSDKIRHIIKTLPKTPVEKIIGMQASLLSLALNCYPDKPEYVDIVLQTTNDIFNTFHIDKTEKIISMQASLLSLAPNCSPDKPEYVDIVLQTTNDIFNTFHIDKLKARSKTALELEKLLKLPVDHYKGDLLQVAQLSAFAPLLLFLDWEPRKDLCCYMLENALQHACIVPDVEMTNKVLGLVQTLYRQQPDCPIGEEGEEEQETPLVPGGIMGGGGGLLEEMEADVCLLAKFLHNFHSDDPNLQYLMLQAIKEQLCAAKDGEEGAKSSGGGGSVLGAVRRQHTLPALFFIALQLAIRFHANREQDENWGKKCERIVGGVCRQLTERVAHDERGELALRMYLQSALVLDQMPFPKHQELAYEFFSQALALYEDSVTESRAQLAALQLITCSLQQMSCFSEENHEPLRTQCTLCASKLFKKPDQARAVAHSAHLYWDCKVQQPNTNLSSEGSAAEQSNSTTSASTAQPLREGKRVADCLKRSVKTAGQVVDGVGRLQLYVEILDHYIHYFSLSNPQCPAVSSSVINQLTGKIREELDSAGASGGGGGDERERLKGRLNASLERLRQKKLHFTQAQTETQEENLEKGEDEAKAMSDKFSELTVFDV